MRMSEPNIMATPYVTTVRGRNNAARNPPSAAPMDSAPTWSARLFPSTLPWRSGLTKVDIYAPQAEIAHIIMKNDGSDVNQIEISDLGITTINSKPPPINPDHMAMDLRLKRLAKGAKKKRLDIPHKAEATA